MGQIPILLSLVPRDSERQIRSLFFLFFLYSVRECLFFKDLLLLLSNQFSMFFSCANPPNAGHKQPDRWIINLQQICRSVTLKGSSFSMWLLQRQVLRCNECSTVFSTDEKLQALLQETCVMVKGKPLNSAIEKRRKRP